MTINIGWHWRGNVFLIADTAVTHRHLPYSHSTSFNESIVNERSRIVEERHSKLVPLNTNSVVAIAGDLNGAAFFIEELRRERASDIIEAITIVANERRTHEHKKFSLLVGAHDGKSTRLIQFTSSDPNSAIDIPELFDIPGLFEHCESDDTRETDNDAESVLRRVAIVGSADPSLKHLVSLMVTVMAAQEADAQRLLVGAAGFMQSQGVRNYLMDTGVGGAMLGACINNHGIDWLPDLTYQIVDSLSHGIPIDNIDDPHDPDPEGGPLDGQPERVSCAVRSGVGYIFSSYHPDRTLVLEPYVPFVSSDVEPQVMIEHLALGDLPFFVLISSRTGDVVIVDRREQKDAHVVIRDRAIFYSEELVEIFMSARAPGDPSRVIFLPRGKQRGLSIFSERAPDAAEIRRSRNRRKRERRGRKRK